jgi:hypothetical protein
LRFGLPSNPAGGNGQTTQSTTVGDRRYRGHSQALAGYVAFCTLPAFPRPSAVVQKLASVQLYNVDSEAEDVVVLLIGIKAGNRLIVGGEEFHGHRSDPPQSAAE